MNKSYKIAFAILALGTLVLASCTKADDPSQPVGQAIPYTSGTTQTITQILDSLPNATFFDSAYRHAGMEAYLDSLRAGVKGSPFTIFVPTDNAFQAAGFTLQQIGQTSKFVLDSLLFYLTIKGSYTYINFDSLAGNAVLNTVLTDPNIQRSLPASFSTGNPYQYQLHVGVRNGTLWLNGTPVKTAAQIVQGTDGVVWTSDQMVQKPFLETYQVLTQDTTYSFYMTALRIGDSIYQNASNYNLRYFFSDTLGMQLRNGLPYITVLAPTNQAFRNAGFNGIQDIYTYIGKSATLAEGGADAKGRLLRTNLDSILDLHRIGYAPYSDGSNPYFTVLLHTNDMLYNPTVNNILIWYAESYEAPQTTVYSDVDFQNNNGQVVAHRADAPGGRAVNIIAPHDITTLNGIVHRVDNLLLPTP